VAAESWNVITGWRWMFGSEAIPATALLLLLSLVPESPRWLTKQGRGVEAIEILTRVDGPDHARREMAEITDALSHESASLSQLLMPGIRVALLIGVVLAVLQQITGINVILYYGPEIFKQTGVQTNVALLWTILVGGCMALFTLLAIGTVDRLGRKPLMIVGAAGMGVCLLASGYAFSSQQTGAWVLTFILGYIAFFSLSVGPVTWVILAEIFPTKIRGRAMGIATICLWIANYVVSQTFPMMAKNEWLIDQYHHGFPFFVYAVFCAVLVLFMIVAVPETRGKTLEEIERTWMARR
jgi:sugar porter (SP) family MFS transporter